MVIIESNGHENNENKNGGESHDGNHNEVTQMINIKPFPLTYQRGSRHVFAASKRQGAMPSTSTKQLDKGKKKVNKGNKVKHELEQKFDIIDLDSENAYKERATSILLKSNDAKIRDLERCLGMSMYNIEYYKNENK